LPRGGLIVSCCTYNFLVEAATSLLEFNTLWLEFNTPFNTPFIGIHAFNDTVDRQSVHCVFEFNNPVSWDSRERVPERSKSELFRRPDDRQWRTPAGDVDKAGRAWFTERALKRPRNFCRLLSPYEHSTYTQKDDSDADQAQLSISNIWHAARAQRIILLSLPPVARALPSKDQATALNQLLPFFQVSVTPVTSLRLSPLSGERAWAKPLL